MVTNGIRPGNKFIGYAQQPTRNRHAGANAYAVGRFGGTVFVDGNGERTKPAKPVIKLEGAHREKSQFVPFSWDESLGCPHLLVVRGIRRKDVALQMAVMTNCSDNELLAQVGRRGPRANDAFAQLVARHSSLIVNACHRRLASPSDADDAAQAVFLVLWNKADGLVTHGDVAGWLHRVSANVCRNANRSNAARKEHEMKAGEEKQSYVPPWSDVREVIDREMDRLPQKYRSLLINVYFQGHSVEEAAKLLGLNASTCRTRLSRARDMLRRQLTKRGFGIGTVPLVTAIEANANAQTVSNEFLTSAIHLPTQTIPPNIEILAKEAVEAMAIKSFTTFSTAVTVAIATIGTVFVVGALATTTDEGNPQTGKTLFKKSVKKVVYDDVGTAPFMLDFEKARLLLPQGPPLTSQEDHVAFFKKEGMDVSGEGDHLVGVGMIAKRVENSFWDKPTGIQKLLAKEKPSTPLRIRPEGKFPCTFVIQTRENSMGVMRFTRAIPEKDGKPRGLEIEYKLLRSKKPKQAKEEKR